VAPDGTVYVADMGNHRIQFFDATGLYRGQWQTEGTVVFDGPAAVAVGPDRATVYATRGHEDTVLVFGAAGPFPGRWGNKGGGPGQFKNPDGVAVAPDGSVYVVDADNNRIQAFCVETAEGSP
jgi:DNA-binding beta-propeller fold protein YncE